MRRLALRLALAVAALLAAPEAASAFAIGGAAWPGRPARIAYFVAAPSWYRFSIGWAARAWNESGARVHLVEVRSRAQADVVIREDRTIERNGYASIGYQSANHVELRRCAPGCADRFFMAAIAAHELGHVLGLDHPPGGCALMRGDAIYAGCPSAVPPRPWKWQCRLLMRDDIAGAVRLYGGAVHVRGQRWCDREPAPRAVRAPVATPLTASPGQVARLSWVFPAGAVGVDVLRRRGACPALPTSRATTVLADVAGRPGRRGTFVDDIDGEPSLHAAGAWCYRLVPLSVDGRPGRPVDLRVAYPGPPPVPAPAGVTVSDASSIAAGYDTRIVVATPALAWLRDVAVRRRAGTCPTAVDDPASEYGGQARIVGTRTTVDDVNARAAGTWCYAAFLVDDWGRVGATAATASIDFHPPHASDASALTATYRAGTADVRIAWAWPADPDIVGAELFATAGSCAAVPEHDAQPPEASLGFIDRAESEYLAYAAGLAPGAWCFALYANGTSGFWGRGAQASAVIPPG